jgi:hypothetical protein
MTTQELHRIGSCVARLRATPAGDVELAPGDDTGSVYGPVEIAWYRDRLRVKILGAGPASIASVRSEGEAAQDVVFELRLPSLDELPDMVPGAD